MVCMTFRRLTAVFARSTVCMVRQLWMGKALVEMFTFIIYTGTAVHTVG